MPASVNFKRLGIQIAIVSAIAGVFYNAMFGITPQERESACRSYDITASTAKLAKTQNDKQKYQELTSELEEVNRKYDCN